MVPQFFNFNSNPSIHTIHNIIQSYIYIYTVFIYFMTLCYFFSHLLLSCSPLLLRCSGIPRYSSKKEPSPDSTSFFSNHTQEALAQRYAGERIQGLQLLAGVLVRSESIVAVARGGAEFGPRALGHRSFLAAAHRGELKERLNLGQSLGLNLYDLVTWLHVFYFLPHI